MKICIADDGIINKWLYINELSRNIVIINWYIKQCPNWEFISKYNDDVILRWAPRLNKTFFRKALVKYKANNIHGQHQVLNNQGKTNIAQFFVCKYYDVGGLRDSIYVKYVKDALMCLCLWSSLSCFVHITVSCCRAFPEVKHCWFLMWFSAVPGVF